MTIKDAHSFFCSFHTKKEREDRRGILYDGYKIFLWSMTIKFIAIGFIQWQYLFVYFSFDLCYN